MDLRGCEYSKESRDYDLQYDFSFTYLYYFWPLYISPIFLLPCKLRSLKFTLKFYLLPLITGNFESIFGIKNFWTGEEKINEN